MDFQALQRESESASLFEIYRLSVLLRQHLEDPERLQALRARLHPGQEVTYFEAQENRLVAARVLALKQTRLVIQRLDNGQTWTIPLYFVNLDGIDPNLQASQKGLTRSLLKVGDEVGFYDRQNREVYGRIQRLNTKTVTLISKAGQQWRVDYRSLFPVMQSQQSDGVVMRILPPET